MTNRRKKQKRRQKKIRYLMYYTVCFAILAALVFFPFYRNGKTFVWDSDGVTQHFNSLLYYRTWLRGILKNLLVEHRLEIPLWDVTIGYGSDIIRTFHYYAIGDPLNLLSVFVPKAEWMDEFYSILILVRIYLAGLAFSAYCFWHKNDRFATLLGSLLYAFCYWTVFSAVRHPYFINPMIWLPLVLLGVDRIYQKKKPTVYLVSLAFSVLSSFYFGYMICLLVLAYCVLCYVMLFGKPKANELLPWIGRFAVYSLTSLMAASVIFLPVVTCALSAGRIEGKPLLPLLYPGNYYTEFWTGLLTGTEQNWARMGYTAFGVLGILLAFVQRKKYRAHKAAFLFLTGCMLLPFAGYVFNGFSYATNRFAWAYAMAVAYMFVCTLPDLAVLAPEEKKRLLCLGGLYTLFCLCLPQSRTSLLLVSLVLFGLLLAGMYGAGFRMLEAGEKGRFQLCMLTGLMLCLAMQAYMKYAPTEGNYIADFTENNQAQEYLTTKAPSILAKEQQQADAGFWRYEQYGTNERYNAAVALKIPNVSYYWSLTDGNFDAFQRELNLNHKIDFQYTDLDGRSFLDALTSVRYFLSPAEKQEYVPYGYTQAVNTRWVGDDDRKAQQKEAAGESTEGLDAKKYVLRKNENSLPLGFTYDTWISRETYEGLTPMQKQQALLQSVVLADSTLPTGKPVFDEVEKPFTVSCGESVEERENGFFVRKAGAYATLQFEGEENSEVCLRVQGFDFDGIPPSEWYTQEQWEALTVYEKNQVREQEKKWINPDVVNLVVQGNSRKILSYATERYSFYADFHDFIVNTGYQEQPLHEIIIFFPREGYYTFESMEVICQPVQRLQTYVEERGEVVLENLEIEGGKIRGTITLEKKKALFLSLLYSEGWSARVDGKKAALLQANTSFMALELEEGEHVIELTYRTPWLRAGVCLSIIGSLLILFFYFTRRYGTM